MPVAQTLDGYKTAIEVAQIFNVTTQRVRLLCSQGRFQGAINIGRQWLIPEEAISSFKWERKRPANKSNEPIIIKGQEVPTDLHKQSKGTILEETKSKPINENNPQKEVIHEKGGIIGFDLSAGASEELKTIANLYFNKLFEAIHTAPRNGRKSFDWLIFFSQRVGYFWNRELEKFAPNEPTTTEHIQAGLRAIERAQAEAIEQARQIKAEMEAANGEQQQV